MMNDTCLMLRARRRSRRGQAMLMTIVALGGSILGATTIAGLLMVYQIRQASDLNDSTRAIFAADTGLEWGIYQYLNPGQGSAPILANGAAFTLTCYDANQAAVACTDEKVKNIRSVGKSGQVSRAFELNF